MSPLTADQTYQISPTVSFQAFTVASGQALRLPADPGRTRACRASHPSLRVYLPGGERSDTHGYDPVIIPRGWSAVVKNESRGDVGLYITAAEGDLD